MSYSAGHVQDAHRGDPSLQPTAEPGWEIGWPSQKAGVESHGRVCVAGLDEGTLPGTERQGSPQILCGVHVEHPDY